MSPINNNHQQQQQQQRRHRQTSMPPPIWQTLQIPSQDLGKRQRASTMNDHQFPTVTPSINVLSPSHLHPPEIEQDYFTFISAQHNQPSSPPPQNSNIPEIRLAVAPTTLLTPDTRSLHSLAPPSVISDYDLFVSARQSFELSPSSAVIASNTTPSFHKHLADHIMTSGMTHDTLLLESPSLLETLFPTLQDWNQKSLFSKLSALTALPLVFIFTLTLPVAEIDQIKVNDIEVIDGDNDDDDPDEESAINYLSVPTAAATAAITASDHDLPAKVMVDDIDTKQGWNKQLLMIQCIISTVFILTVFAGNIEIQFLHFS